MDISLILTVTGLSLSALISGIKLIKVIIRKDFIKKILNKINENRQKNSKPIIYFDESDLKLDDDNSDEIDLTDDINQLISVIK